MVIAGGSQCRGGGECGGARTVLHAAFETDSGMGKVPPASIPGGSHPAGGGPFGSVWGILKQLSLPFSFSLSVPPPLVDHCLAPSNGLIEQFNQTLKNMICTFVHDDAKNWDRWLEPLMFAIREVSQASTWFSSFKVYYGCWPWEVLDVLSLEGGTYRCEKRNSVRVGPERKTPYTGVAQNEEFAPGPGTSEPYLQQVHPITRICTGRESASIAAHI